jgi:serine/threonine-protein kinase HipA
MALPELKFCPGTLAESYNTYSKACLNQLFNGKKVSHILPYKELLGNKRELGQFLETQKRVSISGVQEKYSVLLDKKEIRLIKDAEQGTYILKTIPAKIKNAAQTPANEHLTLQIAQQVYGIETAANCLIFFGNGDPALLVKRFDINGDGKKLALEDFASLAGKTPQRDGEDYKYQGNYSDLFEIMRHNLPAYKVESVKLLKLIIFNYLFSNGDAHFKNFSILETALGDYRLSPAYDLLNSRIHIEDKDFALDDALLPRNLAIAKVKKQIFKLANLAGISESMTQNIFASMTIHTEKVEKLINASFLNEKLKRNYLQAFQSRLKKIQQD